MRVAIQWSLANPRAPDWYSITRDGDWRGLPKRSHPSPGDPGTMQADAGPDFGIQTVLDPASPEALTEGWCYAVIILGTYWSMDHIHAKTTGANGLAVTGWNDSPAWAGNRHALEWTYGLPTFDAQTGRVRMNITKRGWHEDESLWPAERFVDMAAHMPWSSFSEPGPANMVMHSVWLTPDLLDAHEAIFRATQDQHGMTDPSAWVTESEKLQNMIARWS